MTIVLKNVNYINSSVALYQNIMDRLLMGAVVKWKSYRREQSKLRRLYLSSPAAQRFPWRVWKVHGAFLNEIDNKHL